MVLLLCPLPAANRLTVSISLVAYFAGIIHAFVCRKEYLIRLDIYQSKQEQIENQALYESIEKEYDSDQETAGRIIESEPTLSEVHMSDREFVRKIRNLNAPITDETVSAYLDKIESVLTNIFDYVEKHPEKQDAVRTLNNYYMPEIVKLLERYIELSNNPMKNHQMTAAMAEIESVLITITEAFQNLYNSMFNDITSEISTDVKVLKDIFVQNGLTEGKNELFVRKRMNVNDEK
ncbi:5-bromo-4-chloroindolyl phosphate hydrolysis family protein [Sporomusa aerivorans]|uniref:5-bromo-4-chloroindolyl phosphate hydrolysis family protein n=1 Tax=Sporomusa aerivorans TaxID=204936 RepID=UPI00352A3873